MPLAASCRLHETLFLTCGFAGQYHSGTCGPTGTSDYTCRDCAPACGEGQYIARSCTDGLSFSDTVCATCKTCPYGTFMSAKCTGTDLSDPVQVMSTPPQATASMSRTCCQAYKHIAKNTYCMQLTLGLFLYFAGGLAPRGGFKF
jgi:hypothetical protein